MNCLRVTIPRASTSRKVSAYFIHPQNVTRTWTRHVSTPRCPRHFSSTAFLLNSKSIRNDSSLPPSLARPAGPSTGETSPSSSEPRMAIAFTCTVAGCGERSAHHFTKRAYEKGVVLVQCPKCKNRHLIADNLGWFKESTEDGRLKTVEDILRAKGEGVTRGRLDIKDTGVVEYTD